MTTKSQRKVIVHRLGELMDAWGMMDDTALLAEARKVFGSIVSASRYDCIKVLVMSHVGKLED